jgi:alanine-synthesizing transaminase
MFAERTNWNLAQNRLSQALCQRRAAGARILDLTVSNPTECGFQYDAQRILAALQNPAALKYDPNPRGLQAAREAVANYYYGVGAETGIDDLILTTSTSEAYSFVFRLLCNAGDELLIPAPSYPLLGFLADALDVKLVRYHLLYDHGWQIDFHGLERAITKRSRAVVVVNPNNPTGNFVSDSAKRQLNEICADNNLVVIADEVFLDFGFEAREPNTLASNTRVLTFVLSGLSKIAGLPQMKLAWLLVNGPAQQKQAALEKLEVISDTFLSLNAPVQLAVGEFLNGRFAFQEQVLSRTKSNLHTLDTQLAKGSACNRLEIEGGWYATLRIPAIAGDEEFALELLEKRDVYIHPGHFFDFPGEGYVVLSLITPEEEFAEGVRRLIEIAG